MMGTAHNNPSLPPTIVRLDCSSPLAHQLTHLSVQAFGVYNQSVYIQSAARKDSLNISVTTAAEVST